MLAKLDELVGLESHFGIKDEVLNAFPTLASEIRNHGFQVHRHFHFSKESVGWDPELDVQRESWFFDQLYSRDRNVPDTVSWVVFHADYPFLIGAYVDFLSQAVKQGRLERGWIGRQKA